MSRLNVTDDFDNEPNPQCAWCEDPAGEQIHMGTDARTGHRRYSWLCDRCAKDAKTEKEWSRGG